MTNFPYPLDDPRWYVFCDGTKVGLFSLRKHMCTAAVQVTVCLLCRLCISPPINLVSHLYLSWFRHLQTTPSILNATFKTQRPWLSRITVQCDHDHVDRSSLYVFSLFVPVYVSNCSLSRLSNQIFFFPCFLNHQPLPIFTRSTGLTIGKLVPD